MATHDVHIHLIDLSAEETAMLEKQEEFKCRLSTLYSAEYALYKKLIRLRSGAKCSAAEAGELLLRLEKLKQDRVDADLVEEIVRVEEKWRTAERKSLTWCSERFLRHYNRTRSTSTTEMTYDRWFFLLDIKFSRNYAQWVQRGEAYNWDDAAGLFQLDDEEDDDYDEGAAKLGMEPLDYSERRRNWLNYEKPNGGEWSRWIIPNGGETG
jgi:hypothetical protein